MLINHAEEKLKNVVIYFVENTKYCGKTKLIKLLYFLDFQHFSMTGRSVTGLDYFAWPNGPVPVSIFNEIESPKGVLAGVISSSKKNISHRRAINNIVPLKAFSAEHFSKRELKLLKELSDQYVDSSAEDMVEATHLERLPWHEVYEVQGRKQKLIPYEYAIKKSEYEQVIKNAQENMEIKENYK